MESPRGAARERRLLIPMAGVIDKDAELKRLDKEIARLTQNVARTESKLERDKLADSAPGGTGSPPSKPKLRSASRFRQVAPAPAARPPNRCSRCSIAHHRSGRADRPLCQTRPVGATIRRLTAPPMPAQRLSWEP